MSNHHTSDQNTVKASPFSWLRSKRALKWMEVGLAVTVSLLIGILFAVFAKGGPNSSDITLYMNVGMNGIKMPFILNRYFHVFLQAIFVKLAPSPIQGYHAFWGFIIGTNICLVYLAARKVLRRSNIIHGILAVLIYFSFSVIADASGVVVVDLTAMTMMLAVFTVYIFSLNNQHNNPWIVGLLGLLFFFALKTKETTLPIGVLFIGLGWVEGEIFRFRSLLKNLLYLLLGILIGVILFGVLSWIFLNDPLFGLRIREWREFIETYAVNSLRVIETMNAFEDGSLDDWYRGYWFEFTLLPFLLYLFSGIKLKQKLSIQRNLLWVVPLIFIVFLIISVNNRIGYLPRLGYPIIPILAILAPQFIDLEWPEDNKKRRRAIEYFLICLSIAIGIRIWIKFTYGNQNLDLSSVILLFYYPFLITLLFALFIFFRKSLLWNIVCLIVIVSLLVTPISSNLRSMFIVKKNYQEWKEIILPFAEFDDYLYCTSEIRFYVGSEAFTRSRIRIGKNIDEVQHLFNVYFDCNATRDNFTFGEISQEIADKILATSYDFVLITMDDWIVMQEPEDKLARVKEAYEVVFGSGGDLVLLISE